jgi:hypothetical protein
MSKKYNEENKERNHSTKKEKALPKRLRLADRGGRANESVRSLIHSISEGSMPERNWCLFFLKKKNGLLQKQ